MFVSILTTIWAKPHGREFFAQNEILKGFLTKSKNPYFVSESTIRSPLNLMRVSIVWPPNLNLASLVLVSVPKH